MTTPVDPDLVADLRARHAAGQSSAEMLRFLDDHGLSTVDSMSHFRSAFGLGSYDVSPIGGWFADGAGELDDEAVSRLLDGAIAEKERRGLPGSS